MLVLSRRAGESLIIGDDVRIKILDIHGHQARLGIEAPGSVAIVREELHRAVAEANQDAARTEKADPADIARRLKADGDGGAIE